MLQLVFILLIVILITGQVPNGRAHAEGYWLLKGLMIVNLADDILFCQCYLKRTSSGVTAAIRRRLACSQGIQES